MDLEQLIQQWQAEGKTPQEIEALKEQHLAQQSETVEEAPQDEPQWQSGEIALDEVVLTPSEEEKEEEEEKTSKSIERPDVVQEEEPEEDLEMEAEKLEEDVDDEEYPTEIYESEAPEVEYGPTEEAIADSERKNSLLTNAQTYLTPADQKQAEMLVSTMDKQGKPVGEIQSALDKMVERKSKKNLSLSTEKQNELADNVQAMIEDGEDDEAINAWVKDFKIENGSVSYYDSSEDESEDAFRGKVSKVAQQMLDDGRTEEEITKYIQDKEEEWRDIHEASYIQQERGNITESQATELSPEWNKDKEGILNLWKKGKFTTAERPAYEAWKAAGKPNELNREIATSLGYAMTPQQVAAQERKMAVIPDWMRGDELLEGVHFTLTNQFPQALKGIELSGMGAVHQKNQAEASQLMKMMDEGLRPDAMVVVGGTISPRTGTRIGGKKMTAADAMEYYRQASKEFPSRMLQKISELKGLQDVAQVYDNPIFLDEDGITFEDVKGAVGRQIPQLAMSAFTFGVGAFGQEYGSAYVDNLFAIAEKKYGTKEPTEDQLLEIIDSGEDEAGVAVGTGFVSGSLEFIGAKQVVGKMLPDKAVRNLLRGEFKNVLKAGKQIGRNSLSGALTEALTEGSQGIAQDVGRGIATGEKIELDPMKTAEEALQGGLIGGLLPGLGGSVRIIGEGYRIANRNDGSKLVLDGQKTAFLQPESVKNEIAEQDQKISNVKTALQGAVNRGDTEAATVLNEELQRQEDIKSNMEAVSYNTINQMTDSELLATENKKKEIRFLEGAANRAESREEADILNERVQALKNEIESDYDIVKTYPDLLAQASDITVELDKANQDLERKIRANEKSTTVRNLEASIKQKQDKARAAEDVAEKELLQTEITNLYTKLDNQRIKDNQDIDRYKKERDANAQEIEGIWNALQKRRPTYDPAMLDVAKVVGKGDNVSNADQETIRRIQDTWKSDRDAVAAQKKIVKALQSGKKETAKLTDSEKIAFRFIMSEDLQKVEEQQQKLWEDYQNDVRKATSTLEFEDGNKKIKGMPFKAYRQRTQEFVNGRAALVNAAGYLKQQIRNTMNGEDIFHHGYPGSKETELARAIVQLQDLQSNLYDSAKKLQEAQELAKKGEFPSIKELSVSDKVDNLLETIGNLKDSAAKRKAMTRLEKWEADRDASIKERMINAARDKKDPKYAKSNFSPADNAIISRRGWYVKRNPSDPGNPVIDTKKDYESVVGKMIEGRPIEWTSSSAAQRALDLLGYNNNQQQRREAENIIQSIQDRENKATQYDRGIIAAQGAGQDVQITGVSLQEATEGGVPYAEGRQPRITETKGLDPNEVVEDRPVEGFDSKETNDLYDAYNGLSNALKVVSRSLAGSRNVGLALPITQAHRDISQVIRTMRHDMVNVGKELDQAQLTLARLEDRDVASLKPGSQAQLLQEIADVSNEVSGLETKYQKGINDSQAALDNFKKLYPNKDIVATFATITTPNTSSMYDTILAEKSLVEDKIEQLRAEQKANAAANSLIGDNGGVIPESRNYNKLIEAEVNKLRSLEKQENDIQSDLVDMDNALPDEVADSVQKIRDAGEAFADDKYGKAETGFANQYAARNLWKLLMGDIQMRNTRSDLKVMQGKWEAEGKSPQEISALSENFRAKAKRTRDKRVFLNDDSPSFKSFAVNTKALDNLISTIGITPRKGMSDGDLATSVQRLLLGNTNFDALGIAPEQASLILDNTEVQKDMLQAIDKIDKAKAIIGPELVRLASSITFKHVDKIDRQQKEQVVGKADYYSAAYKGLSKALNQFRGDSVSELNNMVGNAVRNELRAIDALSAKIKLPDRVRKNTSLINQANDWFKKIEGRDAGPWELEILIKNRIPVNKAGVILEKVGTGSKAIFPGQEYGRIDKGQREIFEEGVGLEGKADGYVNDDPNLPFKYGKRGEIPAEFTRKMAPGESVPQPDLVKIIMNLSKQDLEGGKPAYVYDKESTPTAKQIDEIRNRVQGSKYLNQVEQNMNDDSYETAVLNNLDSAAPDSQKADVDTKGGKRRAGETLSEKFFRQANTDAALVASIFGTEADALTDEVAAILKESRVAKDNIDARIKESTEEDAFTGDPKIDEEIIKQNNEANDKIRSVVKDYLTAQGLGRGGRTVPFAKRLSQVILDSKKSLLNRSHRQLKEGKITPQQLVSPSTVDLLPLLTTTQFTEASIAKLEDAWQDYNNFAAYTAKQEGLEDKRMTEETFKRKNSNILKVKMKEGQTTIPTNPGELDVNRLQEVLGPDYKVEEDAGQAGIKNIEGLFKTVQDPRIPKNVANAYDRLVNLLAGEAEVRAIQQGKVSLNDVRDTGMNQYAGDYLNTLNKFNDGQWLKDSPKFLESLPTAQTNPVQLIKQLNTAFPDTRVFISKAKMQEALLDGGYDHVNVDNIRGMYADGSVLINPEGINAETPIHEFGHIWAQATKNERRDLYNKGVELLKDSDIYKEIDALRSNPDSVYYGMDNASFHEEVMATAIGRAGAIRFDNEAAQKGWQQYLQDMFNFIAEKLGVSLDTMTLQDFLDQANAEIITGKRIENDLKRIEKLVGKADRDALANEAASQIEFLESSSDNLDIVDTDGSVDTVRRGISFMEKIPNASKNALKDAKLKKQLLKGIYDKLNLKGTVLGPDGEIFQLRDLRSNAKAILAATKNDLMLRDSDITLQQVKELNSDIDEAIQLGAQTTPEARQEMTYQGYSIIQGAEDLNTPADVQQVLSNRDLTKDQVNKLLENKKSIKTWGMIGNNLRTHGVMGALGNVIAPASNDDFYGLVQRLLPKTGGSYRNEVNRVINDILINPLKNANYQYAEKRLSLQNAYKDIKTKVFGSPAQANKVLRGQSGISMKGDIPLTNSQMVMIYNYLKDPSLYGKLQQGNVDLATMRRVVDTINKKGNEKLKAFAFEYANIFTNQSGDINAKLQEHGIKPLSGQLMSDFTLSESESKILEDVFDGKVPEYSVYTPFTATGFDKDVENDFGVINNENSNQAYTVIADNLKDRGKHSEFYLGTNSLDTNMDKYGREVMRSVAFLDFAKNVSAFFDNKNLRAAKVKLGKTWEAALKDSLRRIITGTSLNQGQQSELGNKVDAFLNRAIAGVMFLNTKSAILQTISIPNFVVASGLKYFNHVPGTKGFGEALGLIRDSGFFRLRGAKDQDVLLDEMISRGGSKGFWKAYDKFISNVGYYPTKTMDKFAIAIGGAPMVAAKLAEIRKNNPNMPDALVKEQAMVDFQHIANEAQQSTQQDRLGMTQTTRTGSKILSFTNAPQQFARIIGKNMREMQATASNMLNGSASPLAFGSLLGSSMYYLTVQYGVFAALQNALTNAFNDNDGDDEEDRKKIEDFTKNFASTVASSAGLNAALGVGLIEAGIAIKQAEDRANNSRMNEAQKRLYKKEKFLEALANMSPAVGTKIREIDYGFLGKKMYKTTEGPLEVSEKWMRHFYKAQALTGLPAAEIATQLEGIGDMMSDDLSTIEGAARALGWSRYNLQEYTPGAPEFRSKSWVLGTDEGFNDYLREISITPRERAIVEATKVEDSLRSEWDSSKEIYKQAKDEASRLFKIKKRTKLDEDIKAYEDARSKRDSLEDLNRETKKAFSEALARRKALEAGEDIEPPTKKIVEHKDSEEDVLGRAYKDGTIEISPALKGEERKQVIAHEKEHAKQMKDGDLTYTEDSLTWRGKKYPRKNGRLLYKGRWIEEGSSDLPWEVLADSAAEKKVGGNYLGEKFTDKKGTKKP